MKSMILKSILVFFSFPRTEKCGQFHKTAPMTYLNIVKGVCEKKKTNIMIMKEKKKHRKMKKDIDF